MPWRCPCIRSLKIIII